MSSSQMAQLLEKQVIKRRQNFSSKTVDQRSAPTSCDSESHSGDEFAKKRAKKRRGNLPKEATHLLRSWLLKNIYSAYPSEDIKAKLASDGKVSLVQVSNWFINARRRYVPELIERDGGDPHLYRATRKSLHTVKRLGQEKQKRIAIFDPLASHEEISSRIMRNCMEICGDPRMYNLHLLSIVAVELRDKIIT